MIALLRAILAFVASVFTYIDPTGPPYLLPAIYTTLALYCVYSAALYVATVRRKPFVPIGVAHWIDIGWYLILVAFSGGSNSAYFLFFFFAVLVASFRSGVNSGLRAAAFSAALFTLVGYSAVTANEFQLSRFLLRPVYLLVLGYMIAYWGGQELRLRRQLELLKDVTVTLNPRFGTHHLMGHVVRMLREFYGARVCLLLLSEQGTDSCLVFRVEAGEAGPGSATAEKVSADSVRGLMPVGGGSVLISSGRKGHLFGRVRSESYDLATKEHTAEPADTFSTVSCSLAADSFLSVPVTYQRGVTGRLIVVDSVKSLGRADADFIVHVFEHTRPFIENVRLVDTLASGAAQDERQKIARDIHDGVIQPYIGLQLGLEALRRQADGNEVMSKGIERLISLTESGIEDLRQYVGGLKTGGERKGSLLPALRRFGAKFSEATGVAVRVETEAPDAFINDRLAGEIFQMATEALSNIRRHSEAKTATVRVACGDRNLSLRVTNDGPPGDNAGSFIPRSITERAASLGGTVFVRRPPQGGAVVEVDIPL